jgi:hypothetical protein
MSRPRIFVVDDVQRQQLEDYLNSCGEEVFCILPKNEYWVTVILKRYDI